MPELRERQGNRIFGAVVGVCTNNKDPENRGRVKVKYPWLDGTLESDWARVATFYAGKGRGSYFMPEVGDEVLLMFHGGDPEKPYVIGSVWNGPDVVPGPGNPNGKNDDKWFESRSAHQLKFNDGGSPSITLIDSSKNNSFHIDTSGDTITQKAATGDIFWQAPNGSINLECVDLNVSCTNSAVHKTDTTDKVTVGANQTVTVQTGQGVKVGARCTQKTPDATLSYSVTNLTAGVANATAGTLTAKIKEGVLQAGSITRTIGKQTATVQKYGLLASTITHNGAAILDTSKTDLGLGGATVSFAGGVIALKGGFVGIIGKGMVNVAGGLVGLNPKIMCFPVAKLLDPITSPFLDFHNVVPWVPVPVPVIPMVPHLSMGPILNGIAPSILVNGRPAAGVGADAIGFHVPIVGIIEVPIPPRCLGRILNVVFLKTLSAAMTAYSMHKVVNNAELTTANKVSAVVQAVIGFLIGFIPLPIMTGSIVLGAPSVAVNGQPPGLLLTPMGAYTCSNIPIVPNALSLGFSNVIAGIDFGEMFSQLLRHFVMGGIMFGIKKLSGRVFGHPVDAVHGAMFSTDVDVDLPGPLPLKLERTYSSVPAKGIALGQGVYAEAPPSTLGPGWRHTFEEWIHDDGRALQLHTADGLVKRPPRPGDSDGAKSFDVEEALDLERQESALLVRGKDGLTRRFVPRAPGDPWHRLVSTTDEWGNAITLEHDHRGRVSRLRDSAGRILRFLYGEDGLLDAIRLVHAPDRADIDVRLVSYVHDTQGDLREALDRGLVAKRFDYDAGHLLTREVDRNGYAFHFEYDDQGRCVRTYGDDDAFYGQIEFLGEGTSRVTDGYGQATLYRADEHGRLLAEVTAAGRTTRWEHDAAGRVVLEEKPDGARWCWEYDERGNRTSTERPDGTRTICTYDAADRPLALTTPDGSVWRASFEDGGRRETYVSPTGAVRRLHRDARGLVERMDLPTGGAERRRFDVYGNAVEIERPGGGVWRMEHDELGQMTALVGPRGERWTYAYDAAGRLTTTERPDGTAARYEWDAEGNVTRERDGNRIDNRFAWDVMGRLREKIDASRFVTRYEHGLYRDLRRIVLPDGAEVRFEHDVDLNVVRMVTPDGRDERYTVDGEGRLTGIAEPGGGERRLAYDALGRLTAVHLADGSSRTYEYTPLGQLAAVHVARSGAPAPVEEARYQYDAEGRLALEIAGAERRRYEYDAGGNRTRLAVSDGWDVRYERDDAGLMTAMVLPDGSRHGFEHDRAGRVSRWELPAGLAEEYAYDPVGRLATQSLRRGTVGHGAEVVPASFGIGTSAGAGAGADVAIGRSAPAALLERRYRYDAEGLLAELTDSRHGRAKFGYDDSQRLVAADHEDGRKERFAFDEGGNLTGAPTGVGAYVGQRLMSWQAAARGRVAAGGNGTSASGAAGQTHVYDERGRLVRRVYDDGHVRRYEYDEDGRLLRVIHPEGGTTEYEYDAFGRRTAKVHEGARTEYGWDGLSLLWERAGAGGAKTWYAGDGDRLAPIAKVGPDGTFTYHGDHQGTPIELRDASGDVAWEVERRSAFGRTTVRDGARTDTPHRLPGQYEDDETGLHYNLFRYYDPETGRYLTPDPIGVQGGPNFYAYVNDPVNWSDPFGLAAGCTLTPEEIARQQARGRPIVVLGHLDPGPNGPGTRSMAGTPGYRVIPPAGWTMKGNMQWMQQVVTNGDAVYLATTQPRPGPSVFRQELRFLESRGYVRVGDFMVPGGPGGRGAITTPAR